MQNPFSDRHIRKTLSVLAFFAAIVFAVIAMFTPPLAIIDASVLWFTSQLFVFISALLGVNMNVDFGNKKIYVSEKMGTAESETETNADK